MTLALTLGLGVQVHAATADPASTRLWGASRYETATSIVDSGWTQSDYAIVAYGENYPDALGAAALSKQYNAPIMLTQSASLDAGVKSELTRLGVKRVFILGGSGVVTLKAESQINAMGIYTTRLGGADRFDTSVLIANQLQNVSEIAVVNSDDFGDALSISPVAGLKNMPILLVTKNEVKDVVKNYVKAHNITKTYVMGQDYTISDAVANQFPNVQRITGYSRYAKNLNVMDTFKDTLKFDTIYSASGDNFPDSLAGVGLAVKNGNPIIFVSENDNRDTKDFLADKAVTSNVILGGEGAVRSSKVHELFGDPLPVDTSVSLYNKLAASGKYNNNGTTLTPKDSKVHLTIYKGEINDLSNDGTQTADYMVNATALDIPTRAAIKDILKMSFPLHYETAYMEFIVTARQEVFESAGTNALNANVVDYYEDRLFRAAAGDQTYEAGFQVGIPGKRMNVFGEYAFQGILVDRTRTGMDNDYFVKQYKMTEYKRADYNQEKYGEYLDKAYKYFMLSDYSHPTSLIPKDFNFMASGMRY